jgi:hypothetical protein
MTPTPRTRLALILLAAFSALPIAAGMAAKLEK